MSHDHDHGDHGHEHAHPDDDCVGCGGPKAYLPGAPRSVDDVATIEATTLQGQYTHAERLTDEPTLWRVQASFCGGTPMSLRLHEAVVMEAMQQFETLAHHLTLTKTRLLNASRTHQGIAE
jgi:hypothetical protein